MNKENCALKLVDEIMLYYDARSKKHQITTINYFMQFLRLSFLCVRENNKRNDLQSTQLVLYLEYFDFRGGGGHLHAGVIRYIKGIVHNCIMFWNGILVYTLHFTHFASPTTIKEIALQVYRTRRCVSLCYQSWFALLTKCKSGDQIKNFEMGIPCSMYGEKMHTRL